MSGCVLPKKDSVPIFSPPAYLPLHFGLCNIRTPVGSKKDYEFCICLAFLKAVKLGTSLFADPYVSEWKSEGNLSSLNV